jgi:hypothetical protein
VPLDADHPPAGIVALDPLDCPVVRAGADSHRIAEPVDRLMMDGIHGERVRADNRREAALRIDPHAVHARIALVVHLVCRDVLAL